MILEGIVAGKRCMGMQTMTKMTEEYHRCLKSGRVE